MLSKSIFRLERLYDGMVSVDSVSAGQYFYGQLWVTSKARKPSTCALSGEPIAAGDDVYRPITNKSNRSMRMLAAAVDLSTPPHTPQGGDTP